MALYAVTVFISAFLLFLVQPLIGKYVLPWFGGGPGVWTTCLLFFQLLLLTGYAYSHWLATKLSQKRQVLLHVFLLAGSLVLLPITPSETWKPAVAGNPTWGILGLLAVCVGGTYFLLSTTGPLLQAWYSRTWPSASTYRLYSLSNLGSLLAIGAYPFVVEPSFGLRLQSRLWSFGYLAFVFLCGICAVRALRSRGGSGTLVESGAAAAISAPPTRTDYVFWTALTALSSTMLLAATNQMCQDVAVIPLLWLVPLGLYLISFIVCFHSERWYCRPLFGALLAAALGEICFVMSKGIQLDIRIQIASYCAVLFACCMVCHGELFRLKPGTRYLTSYYLMIAVGGALGGLFVNLVSPRLFSGYWEFQLGLAATALVFLILLFRDPRSRLFNGRPLWAWMTLYIGFLSLLVVLGAQMRDAAQDNIEVARNFFGVLRVVEEEETDPEHDRFVLMHGRIEHGFQLRAQEKRYWPTSYYGPNSGVGIAIRFHPRRLRVDESALRIGIVGLGTGSLAAYGEQGDYFRFYEINPEVLRLSDRYFSYRRESQAAIDVVLGDARISMENERARSQPQNFDVLAVDAFSSDAIPLHLLTRECYRTYSYHLKPDGILAMHISSRYFDLAPPVRSLAEFDAELGVRALMVEDDGSRAQETDGTHWVLITSNPEFLGNPEVQRIVRNWDSSDPPPLLFTDDYSDLFRLLYKKIPQ